ncbi:MAG: preprotein translocase subunit SecG [Paracoccaceae bacterium]
MSNIILVIHLILALCLIGVVLLQRSEGGGLGIGGGGGGGVMSGRSAATALARLTWLFAGAFILTSVSLTVIAARNAAGDSVIERLGTQTTAPAPTPAPVDLGNDLLPPSATDAPATPPKSN